MPLSMRSLLTLALFLAVPLHALGVEDVPFVTTPDHVTLAMLEMAKVGPRDHVIDLGSGDGRIVIVAAKRFGASGLGVEIVPDLVMKSRENAQGAGVASRVEFREQDLFTTDLSKATVVTLYLLPAVNLQLRPKLLALRPGVRVVSHDWDMGEWEPDQSRTLAVPDKTVGVEKTSRVYLWVVPARIAGDWCGTGKARGSAVHIAQDFQHVRGELTDGGGTHAFVGRMEGASLRSARAAGQPMELKLDRGRLVLSRRSSPLASRTAAIFVRRKGETCR